MKAILLSVQPQHCENILNAIKTGEIRKFYIEPPFKVYMYCTKSKPELFMIDFTHANAGSINGKVVAEWICNKVDKYNTSWLNGEDELKQTTCLTDDEIMDYMNNYTDRVFSVLNITNLKIYDKPKELGEFGTICHKDACGQCVNCQHLCFAPGSYPCEDSGEEWCGVSNIKPITRPPQSWCYVDELEEI